MLPENAPEIPPQIAELRKLIKFSPRKSIRIALLETNTELPVATGWALARLVAWAFFDQRKSNWIPKEKRTNKATHRPFKARYAYKAGQLYFLYHADRFFRKYDENGRFRRITTEEAAMAMQLYFETGQIRNCFGHRGSPLSMLHNKRNKQRDLMFVYYMMDFLVRATLSGRKDLCTVERARDFVSKADPMDEHLSPSGVEKNWNQYRDAAPYIYAFYPKLYCIETLEAASEKGKKITEEDWLIRIAQLSAKSTLEECLGYAAFAVDVLMETETRHVRENDFKSVPRKEPLCRPFNADELLLINSYERKYSR